MEARHRISALGGAGELGIRRGSLPVLSARFLDAGRRARSDSALGMVPGAFCWIVLTLAGAAMYRLAREWLPAPDAFFAAVFYALNPYHLLIVYWRSAYAELLAAALLPLLLLCLLPLNEPVFAQPDPAGSGELASQAGLGKGTTSVMPNLRQKNRLQPPRATTVCQTTSLSPTLWLSLTLAAAWLTNAPAAVMIHYSTAGLALVWPRWGRA